MPLGDVGLVAKVVETIFSWVVSEDGFKEMQKRSRLKAKKKECQDALAEHRWDDLRTLTVEYERLCNAP